MSTRLEMRIDELEDIIKELITCLEAIQDVSETTNAKDYELAWVSLLDAYVKAKRLEL